MDSFELNKIAGAILLALLVTMGLGVGSSIIFAPNMPEQPGYLIEVAQVDTVGADEELQGQAETDDLLPITVRLAAADPAAGESQFRRCSACHSVEEGGANKVGPGLWNIIGATPAAHADFQYSAALEAYAQSNPQWTYAGLDAFIANPRGYIEGTKMAFAGLSDPQDRADLIDYMRALSADPASLDAFEDATAE